MNIAGKTKGVYDLKVHDHACFIYDSEQEWQDIVIPFIYLGLKRGEKCVYGYNHHSKLTIISAFKSAGIDVELYEGKKQLMLLSNEYLPAEDDTERLDQIIAFYIQFIEQASQEGYSAVRFTSENLYTVAGYAPYKNLVEVNARMNKQLFPYYPCISLCQYNRSQTDPLLLKHTIMSHPIIIKNGRIYKNNAVLYDEQDIANDIWEADFWMSIIERENMEKEKLQQIYRLIAENAYDLITIIDPRTNTYKYLSPSHARVVGYTAEELMGNNAFNHMHPEDQPAVMEKLQEGIKNGGGSAEYRSYNKDGEYLWLEAIGKMIVDQDEYNGDILLVTRDITERKLAQQELKKQLDYLNYLINIMDSIFVTYDLNRRVTLVNKAVYDMLGYTVEELVGADVLDIIVYQEIDRMMAYTQARLLKAEPGEFETTVKRKDGSHALVRIKSTPIIENGIINGAMLIMEDISESRKIEREMARMDQLNTIGEMAAGIGHEIRNPMTAVKGFLQIMSQQEDLKQHECYFNIMLEELERANDIISEFLSLAKNKMVDLKPGNLNDIIMAIFPLLQADATLGGKSIELELQDIHPLLLDEKEIRQLVINLVRNGLEAMSDGGTVYISTYLEDNEVVLVIKDEGEGIKHELMEQLGKPFITTKEKGTGLGLAVCYSIAARHEASILPTSSPEGTSFTIRFKHAK